MALNCALWHIRSDVATKPASPITAKWARVARQYGGGEAIGAWINQA